MKQSSNNNTEINAQSTDQMAPKGNRKLIITSAVTAAVACAVCLIPTALLVVAGGSVLALVSSWFGYTIFAALILGTAFIFAFWYSRTRKRRSTCSGSA